jgi:hypothetical protein
MCATCSISCQSITKLRIQSAYLNFSNFVILQMPKLGKRNLIANEKNVRLYATPSRKLTDWVLAVKRWPWAAMVASTTTPQPRVDVLRREAIAHMGLKSFAGLTPHSSSAAHH